VYVNALAELGYDVDALLDSAGVSRSDLEDPDGRVACPTLGAILAHAMQVRPLKNLGMRIAQRTPIGAFPLIDYLVLTSDSVGHGLEQLARYFRLVAASVAMQFRDADDLIHVVYDGPPASVPYEFGITLCLLHFREETEHRHRAEFVSLAYRPDDAAELERVLGCPVRVQASWTGWAITRETWNLPLRRRDPVLGAVLRHHATEIVKRLPAGGGLAAEVRQALATRVAGGDVRVQAVARVLATSVRSLQRRLSDEGCSYQELVDAMRREAAERYLVDRSLSIGEVGYLLGYSEAAAFHRAFKRWTGTTPQAFRQSRRVT
jgi:AraC-like DNA-binding protein